jgi:hypothetical protein
MLDVMTAFFVERNYGDNGSAAIDLRLWKPHRFCHAPEQGGHQEGCVVAPQKAQAEFSIAAPRRRSSKSTLSHRQRSSQSRMGDDDLETIRPSTASCSSYTAKIVHFDVFERQIESRKPLANHPAINTRSRTIVFEKPFSTMQSRARGGVAILIYKNKIGTTRIVYSHKPLQGCTTSY